MAYSNYFNDITQSDMVTTAYTNTRTSYSNASSGPYGSTCTMSYTNYANASHPIPGTFDIGVNKSVFDKNKKIKDSVQEIKDLRNALSRLSTEKVKSDGKAHAVTPALDEVTDAHLAAGQKVRAVQINQLINATKALWTAINGTTTTWPATKTAMTDKVIGEDFKTLADRAQTLADCTQTGYVNRKQDHDGYAHTAGTNGAACLNHASYRDGYYGVDQNAAQGTAGYNGKCAHGW
jgi:hypothetical protein